MVAPRNRRGLGGERQPSVGLNGKTEAEIGIHAMNFLSRMLAVVMIAMPMIAGLPATGAAAGEDDAAAKWYRLAAEQGYAEAQYTLGVMYDLGWNMEQSDVEAVKWFRKAADQGHGAAQYNLGLMYFLGRGVAVDYVRARMWIDLAGEHGDEKAPDGQKELAKYMSPGQIAQARKLVHEWLARHGK